MTLPFSASDGSGPHAIVVGAGFGGLAVAMRLGAAGWRVTVVDRQEAPGGRAISVESGGHRFDLGPTLLSHPDALRRLFLECGHDPDVLALVAPDPLWSFHWEDGTRVEARAEGMEDAVRRISPGDLEGWNALWNEARARPWGGFRGLFERFRSRARGGVMRRVATHLSNEKLRTMMACPPIMVGQNPLTADPELCFPAMTRHGLVAANGGLGDVARAMADAVEAQGGDLRAGVEVVAASARHVELAGGERLEADVVIVGTVPPSRRAPAEALGLFVWHFGTRETADLWPDIGASTMVAGPNIAANLRTVARGRVPVEPLIHLRRTSLDDCSAAPEGGDTFYALVPVPHLGHRGGPKWSGEAGALRDRLLARIEAQVLPGLARHLTAEMLFTPEDVRRRFGTLHGLPAGGHSAMAGTGFLHLVPGPEGGVAGAISGAEALVRNLPLPAAL
ncbi:FAD-dependent oxidoreductase [uncultured Jannaschia sp.]|uniref:phytoene desaturase family protein n=1 Tax=uncultured Jannaschia sp. TaxID=293347 RepID=UPI00262118C9|nr:FAD-dependent oxidoreductase [uncultured Jannaschia sp.]